MSRPYLACSALTFFTLLFSSPNLIACNVVANFLKNDEADIGYNQRNGEFVRSPVASEARIEQKYFARIEQIGDSAKLQPQVYRYVGEKFVRDYGEPTAGCLVKRLMGKGGLSSKTYKVFGWISSDGIAFVHGQPVGKLMYRTATFVPGRIIYGRRATLSLSSETSTVVELGTVDKIFNNGVIYVKHNEGLMMPEAYKAYLITELATQPTAFWLNPPRTSITSETLDDEQTLRDAETASKPPDEGKTDENTQPDFRYRIHRVGKTRSESLILEKAERAEKTSITPASISASAEREMDILEFKVKKAW
jgi:hypothetical protein